MALVQLGILNNYSKQPFLMKSLRELWWAHGRTTNVTRSPEWFRGSRSGTTRPTESSFLSPQGSSIYTFYGGRVTPGHRLRMREPWITQAHGPALMVQLTMSTDLVHSQSSHWHCRWVGGNKTGREDLVDSNRRDICISFHQFTQISIRILVQCLSRQWIASLSHTHGLHSSGTRNLLSQQKI